MVTNQVFRPPTGQWSATYLIPGHKILLRNPDNLLFKNTIFPQCQTSRNKQFKIKELAPKNTL